MLLFPLLDALDPRITPARTKVHLASFNGKEQPLDVYRRGRAAWEEWQRGQNKRNFEREFVVSIIAIPRQPKLWMFAGVYSREGITERPGHEDRWYYDLARLEALTDLEARLVVSHARTDRPSYRDAETIADRLEVHKLRSRTLIIPEFPGYKQVLLSFSELGAVVREAEVSWRTALSSGSGVYVIADTTDGRLYVGVAYGEGGIWPRWSQYLDGHGGNVARRAGG